MAKAPAAASKTKTTAVTSPKKTAAVPADFYEQMARDSGKGMEGADKDSFAIPFISILQKMSPQVDKQSGQYIKGAEAGMFFNTVTNEVLDGNEGITIIQAAYQRRFVRWAPRDGGGGFKGEYTADEVAKMKADGLIVTVDNRDLVVEKKGAKADPKKCDLIADTRNHFVIIISKSGALSPAILALSSTQIKKSRALMTSLANQVWNLPNGKKISPPSFAVKVKATTVGESNDKGSWSGIRFEVISATPELGATPDEYEAAKRLNEQAATIKVTPPPPSSGGGDAPTLD